MKFDKELYKNYRLPKSNPFESIFTIPKNLELIVTFQPNKSLPVYSWFKYKQGFSKDLVYYILNNLNYPKDSIVHDPFLGSGTTALAANELGYNFVGGDLLPLLVFVSNAKIHSLKLLPDEIYPLFLNLNLSKIEDQKLNSDEKWPNIQLVNKSIPLSTQNEFLKIKNRITGLDANIHYKNLLLLGLINCIEPCAFIKKDGGFARLTLDKSVMSVTKCFENEIIKYIKDLKYIESILNTGNLGHSEIFISDARDITLDDHSIDITITSPPYLNKTDYTRVYCLELAFAFVKNFDQLRTLRYNSFSSHVESKSNLPRVNLPYELENRLNDLKKSNLNNPKNPDMARGYFEDLHYSLIENFRLTKQGGRSCWVVWNSRLSGIEFEVDTFLALIAQNIGFVVDKIECIRLTGSSSQQVKQYGEVPLRESIIYLRKL